MFFDEKFRQDFDWRSQYKLRLASVLPHNKQQIADGLKGLSPESIRNRFLGQKKEYTEKELVYLTQMDGYNHYAVGIEEQDGEHRGLAIVRMVRSSEDDRVAEVAITIIDEFQGMGLGTMLIDVIILAALERDLDRLSFTFLPQNEAIIALINRIGIPQIGNNNKDYHQLYLVLKEFDVKEIKERWAGCLPGLKKF